jgi:hypothetical protein
MGNVKYIVVKPSNYEIIIVFSSLMMHSHMANGYRNVISAGFVSIKVAEKDGITSPIGFCYGESDSLNLKSREVEDTKLLNQMFKFGDYEYT